MKSAADFSRPLPEVERVTEFSRFGIMSTFVGLRRVADSFMLGTSKLRLGGRRRWTILAVGTGRYLRNSRVAWSATTVQQLALSD